jgi:hypothetical protein
MPPRIAPLQAVIVPIVSKQMTYEDAKPYCEAILKDLNDSGVSMLLNIFRMFINGFLEQSSNNCFAK